MASLDERACRKADGTEQAILKLKIASANNQRRIADLQSRHQNVKVAQAALRNRYFASIRQRNWKNVYNMEKAPDSRKRPSDRKMPIRVYTSMDKDVWGHAAINAWFQSSRKDGTLPLSVVISPYKESFSQPAYLAATSHKGSNSSDVEHARVQSAPVRSLRPRSPYRISDEPAGLRAKTPAHGVHDIWVGSASTNIRPVVS